MTNTRAKSRFDPSFWILTFPSESLIKDAEHESFTSLNKIQTGRCLNRSDTMRLTNIPEIAQLSTSEKILLVEDLWDSIAGDESSLAVPQSHMDELDRRLDAYESDPDNLLSLEELQTRIEKRK
ncbi:MAG: addiction module protein [Desulfomonilaceae bacterium]